MKITADTVKTEITIQGATFSAPEPFTEGHVLNENEASALNQLLHENIRNNFASKVKEALAEVEGKVENLDMTTLQTEFDAYVEGYEFGVRRTGTRVPKDPVAHEAWKIAGALIRKALKKKGVALDSLPEGKFDELVETASKREDIVDAAIKAVEMRKGIAEISLED